MRLFVASFAIFFVLASCGRVPEPIGYPRSQQRKMQAAHHWEVLAADVANQINNELILNDYLDTPVYVRDTCGDENRPCKALESTAFDESFRDLLISSLVNLGVPTSPIQEEKALTVNYKAQLVYHDARRLRTIRPGLITALTAGVLVLRNAPGELIALAIAGAVDMANAGATGKGAFEVIITTSVVSDGNYLFRYSDIYYLNDADSWHYLTPATPSEIRLTAISDQHIDQIGVENGSINILPPRSN